ncbi:MAG: hypothetical protein M1817_006863 [Caeruleum heppii]|nr:MAG: hypothetical protein M1817_006863 [Caeruleum heppii]
MRLVSPSTPPQQWTSLPTELLLDILCAMPYGETCFCCLSLTDRRMYRLVRQYERTIAGRIAREQYWIVSSAFSPVYHIFSSRCQRTSADEKRLIPQSFPRIGPSFAWLSTIHDRHITMMHLSSLTISHFVASPGKNYPPTVSRWRQIQRLGFLLLYRLSDLPSHHARASYITSLSLDLVAILSMILFFIVKISSSAPLNGHAGSILSPSYPPAKGDLSVIGDILLSLEELTLTHGPDYLYSLIIHHRPVAEQALERQWRRIDEYQMHEPGAPVPERSLTSLLLERFAERLGVSKAEVGSKMWDVVYTGRGWEMSDAQMVEMVLEGYRDG